MSIALSMPGPDGLSEAVRVLREWQYDGAPMRLHPGDLGWHRRFGAALRGLLSEPGFLRPSGASAPRPRWR